MKLFWAPSLALRRHLLPRYWLGITLGGVALLCGLAYWWERQLPSRLANAIRDGDTLASVGWKGLLHLWSLWQRLVTLDDECDSAWGELDVGLKDQKLVGSIELAHGDESEFIARRWDVGIDGEP